MHDLDLMPSLGGPIERHQLQVADLESGELISTWIPTFFHPNMSAEMMARLGTKVYVWRELAIARGAMDVPATWNELLPDFKFMDIATFLQKYVEGKGEDKVEA